MTELMAYDDIVFSDEIEGAPCGVYFLVVERVIIYIGQSSNIRNRTRSHGKRLRWDKCIVIEEQDKQRRVELEGAYIRAYQPAFNVSQNDNHYSTTQPPLIGSKTTPYKPKKPRNMYFPQRWDEKY